MVWGIVFEVIFSVALFASQDWITTQQRSQIAAQQLKIVELERDSLTLQTVLLPRHVGLIGFDQEPPAKKWFAGFERWAGTKVLIQVVPGDPEAQNLANEIAIVLSKFGWQPEMIDEKRSGISMNLAEGVSVFSPASYKGWNPNDLEQQKFAVLGDAARALAVALTKAGLGVGDIPVSGVNGLNIIVDFPAGSDAAKTQYGHFNPPLDGVYVQVGSRPVSLTLQWMAARRKAAAEGTAPAAAPAETK